MNRLKVPLLAVALTLGAAQTSAFASEMTLTGTNNFGSGVSTAYFGGPSTGSFSDIYALNFASNTTITGSGSTSFFTSAPALTTFGIFKGATEVAAFQNLFNTPTNSFYGFAPTNISAGNYNLEIIGTGGSTSSFSGNLTISAVPLPPALPMFGAGILMLAGFSVYRNRKNTTMATVAV